MNHIADNSLHHSHWGQADTWCQLSFDVQYWEGRDARLNVWTINDLDRRRPVGFLACQKFWSAVFSSGFTCGCCQKSTVNCSLETAMIQNWAWTECCRTNSLILTFLNTALKPLFGLFRTLLSYLSFFSLPIISWLYWGHLGTLILQVYLPNNSRPESRHFNTLLVAVLSLGMNLSWSFGSLNPPQPTSGIRSGDDLAQATYLS